MIVVITFNDVILTAEFTAFNANKVTLTFTDIPETHTVTEFTTSNGKLFANFEFSSDYNGNIDLAFNNVNYSCQYSWSGKQFLPLGGFEDEEGSIDCSLITSSVISNVPATSEPVESPLITPTPTTDTTLVLNDIAFRSNVLRELQQSNMINMSILFCLCFILLFQIIRKVIR